MSTIPVVITFEETVTKKVTYEIDKGEFLEWYYDEADPKTAPPTEVDMHDFIASGPNWDAKLTLPDGYQGPFEREIQKVEKA